MFTNFYKMQELSYVFQKKVFLKQVSYKGNKILDILCEDENWMFIPNVFTLKKCFKNN